MDNKRASILAHDIYNRVTTLTYALTQLNKARHHNEDTNFNRSLFSLKILNDLARDLICSLKKENDDSNRNSLSRFAKTYEHYLSKILSENNIKFRFTQLLDQETTIFYQAEAFESILNKVVSIAIESEANELILDIRSKDSYVEVSCEFEKDPNLAIDSFIEQDLFEIERQDLFLVGASTFVTDSPSKCKISVLLQKDFSK